MPYLLLSLSVLFTSSSGIFATFFNKKTKNYKSNDYFFTFILAIFIFIPWLISYIINFSFDASVLIYSLIFALGFTGGFVFEVKAIKTGPLTLTLLLISLSLVCVTIYCILRGWAQFTYLVAVGLVLVCISLFLCLYKGKSKQINFSKKWFLYVFLAFMSNAICSIILREQQYIYHEKHGEMFMAFGSLIFLVITFILFKINDNGESKKRISATPFPMLTGILNFGLNLCALYLAQQTVISTNVIYPVMGVGGLIFTAIFSFIIFKERLLWWQWLGILFGVTAIALLSL